MAMGEFFSIFASNITLLTVCRTSHIHTTNATINTVFSALTHLFGGLFFAVV